MPENKEELFGLLNEFDDKARLFEKIIREYDKNDLTKQEQQMFHRYRTWLEMLITEYDSIDKMRSFFARLSREA